MRSSDEFRATESGRKTRSLRFAAASGGAALTILGMLYGVRTVRASAPAPPPPAATPVSAVLVEAADAPVALEAVGSLRAVREVTVASETPGRVVAIHFEPGARVKAGAHLVQLYSAPEAADRSAAVAKAELARLRYERSLKLEPTGAEPRDRLEERRADLEQARAAVRQLEARIAQKRIVAPFSGELGVRRIDLGQYLDAGQPVTTLTDLQRLYVDFRAPQHELARLKVGGRVRLASDAWPGETFLARINVVEPRVGEETRNVAVQAELANPSGRLRPGMHVTVWVDLPPERGALTIPATALQTSAAGDSVMVVRGPAARREGRAEIVPVQVGRRIGDRVVVRRGLAPGDVVVAEGQLRVQPKSAVRVTRLVSTAGA